MAAGSTSLPFFPFLVSVPAVLLGPLVAASLAFLARSSAAFWLPSALRAAASAFLDWPSFFPASTPASAASFSALLFSPASLMLLPSASLNRC